MKKITVGILLTLTLGLCGFFIVSEKATYKKVHEELGGPDQLDIKPSAVLDPGNHKHNHNHNGHDHNPSTDQQQFNKKMIDPVVSCKDGGHHDCVVNYQKDIYSKIKDSDGNFDTQLIIKIATSNNFSDFQMELEQDLTAPSSLNVLEQLNARIDSVKKDFFSHLGLAVMMICVHLKLKVVLTN